MTKDDVTEKIDYARRRADDLMQLIVQKTLGTLHRERQQAIQEFYFHAVGAFDRVAQLVNESCSLGIAPEDVTVLGVVRRLPPHDVLAARLRSLYIKTRGAPLPADPYSEAGLLFRLYNNRHQVTHRGRNSFHFTLGGPTYFLLDPWDGPSGARSRHAIAEDIEQMLALVTQRCAVALTSI